MAYVFEAQVRKVAGESAWHFATLPFDVSDEIEELTAEHRRGFGSVRVHVTIGGSTWATSLFPDSKAEAYVLPVKKPVRTAEGLADGSLATIRLELAEP